MGFGVLDLSPSHVGLDIWNIGVLQGRLLPKVAGQYQAFPLSAWDLEMRICSNFGIRHLEFIVDTFDPETNPLLTKSGSAAINSLTRETGVQITSVCVDSLMLTPLQDKNYATHNRRHLLRVAEGCEALSIRSMIFPFVDKSSMRSLNDIETVIAFLDQSQEIFTSRSLNLALETDLPPDKFGFLLARTDPSFVNVNYDIGNSASLGFDASADFEAYGKRITNVHVKDRIHQGGSVPLGSGGANLPGVFALLQDVGFSGTLICQAWRGDWGALDTVPQMAWLKNRLIEWGSP